MTDSGDGDYGLVRPVVSGCVSLAVTSHESLKYCHPRENEDLLFGLWMLQVDPLVQGDDGFGGWGLRTSKACRVGLCVAGSDKSRVT